MIGGEVNDLLVSCLKEVQNYFLKNCNKKIKLFEFDNVYNNGFATHPNVTEHREVSEKLTHFLMICYND